MKSNDLSAAHPIAAPSTGHESPILSACSPTASPSARPSAGNRRDGDETDALSTPGGIPTLAGSFSLPTIPQPWPVIEIIQEKPWILEVWELLKTKAPNPTICQPYCCYFRTVIFYLKPYIVRPWHHFWNCSGRLKAEKPGHHFEQWDQIEYALAWDTPLEFNGERFEVGGGTVIWRNKQWWMRHWARRKRRLHDQGP